MIGAIADWFAVTALFKKVHIPIISRHTEIIPRNKERIADNLARFVHEKFFNQRSLEQLLEKANLAEKFVNWLSEPKNIELVTKKTNSFIRSFLNIVDDQAIQSLLINAFHGMLSKVDFSRSLGSLIDSLTRDGRHEPLLNEFIIYLGETLDKEDTQDYLSQGIVTWLETEHPNKEKVLPTQWIGRQGAKLAIEAVGKILIDMSNNPEHKLRRDLDKAIIEAIGKLKSDQEFKNKVENIKQYITDDEKLKTYLGKLWISARKRIIADTENQDSSISKQVENACLWLTTNLINDKRLQGSLNQHINDVIMQASPELTSFLISHISSTVKNWDDAEMSQQIELNIGKDLQYIRINGTVVGGMIGCFLFLVTNIPTIIEKISYL